MCRPTTCKNCKKTTWAGCGQHVASVKATVPADQWCNGDCAPAEGGQRTGVLGRLFGR
ncbi:hypothetical protein [uncultured Nocardioides sp.]|jgi:hypothetical protein|uniref:hypothetical protein n=1 Tax=uncultured Nocardioides sp. TaxID=198441 RepID=UPI00269C758D|tara:strand:- start:37 stop:210 length:174 start_codon:yes stop_codon:yes gene_type:complete